MIAPSPRPNEEVASVTLRCAAACGPGPFDTDRAVSPGARSEGLTQREQIELPVLDGVRRGRPTVAAAGEATPDAMAPRRLEAA